MGGRGSLQLPAQENVLACLMMEKKKLRGIRGRRGRVMREWRGVKEMKRKWGRMAGE